MSNVFVFAFIFRRTMANEEFLEILQEAFMVCGLDEERVLQLVENERLESLGQFTRLED